MTEEEVKINDDTVIALAAADTTDSEPCDCVICARRRKNATKILPAVGLRSGKKLGWDKYGPGRTL